MGFLKQLRMIHGMTQEQVASMSGIAQCNISAMEKKDTLTVKTARRLAPVFGMSWSDMLVAYSKYKDGA